MSKMKFSKYALIYLVPLTLVTHVIGLAVSAMDRRRYGYGHTRVECHAGPERLPGSEVRTVKRDPAVADAIMAKI